MLVVLISTHIWSGYMHQYPVIFVLLVSQYYGICLCLSPCLVCLCKLFNKDYAKEVAMIKQKSGRQSAFPG